MIDLKALHSLTYGLYLITADNDGVRSGCVANTLVQVSAEPPRLAASLNKENATTQAIQESGRFGASVLAEEASMDLIRTFGFKSSREFDKFAEVALEEGEGGTPCVTDGAVARFVVEVDQTVDAGSHLVFVGRLVEALTLADVAPMSYAYYHQIKGGKTPPKAASYQKETEPASTPAPAAEECESAAEAAAPRYGWRCTICGYIEEGYPDGLPADYSCPFCGVGPEMFERVELCEASA